MKLLLFDIDGTLLTTNGAGRPAVESALAELVGRPVSTDGISFSGKTDPQILREVLTLNDAADDLLNGRFPDVVEAFRATMHRVFDPAGADALLGAQALVEQLHADDRFQLALLTGNLQEMAYLKVGAIGFDEQHFPFGAFGSDHADRNELPGIARGRAAAHAGAEPGDVVIIGDTPRDIECGRHGGCTTIAVATGRFDRDTLAEHEPDVLLDSLEDADAFLRAVL
jgi:phosphoglycolate phosphatase-like HAD superfamily hydrolase